MRFALVLVSSLVCCVTTYTHAVIPDSRLTKDAAACFNACDEDDVDCVSQCPNSEMGAGECKAKNTITTEGWRWHGDASKSWATEATYRIDGACVDRSHHYLTPAGAIVRTIVIVVGAVALVTGTILLIRYCDQPNRCIGYPS